MTEEQWLTATDPTEMIGEAAQTAGDRKLRLFCLACCDRVRHHMTDPRSLAAVDFLARTADLPRGRRRGVAAARRAAVTAHRDAFDRVLATPDSRAKAAALIVCSAADAAQAALLPGTDLAAQCAASFAANAAGWAWLLANPPDWLPDFDRSAGDAERRHQADLLRDIVGNPYRPVAFDGRWRTPTVVGLAAAIYADRAYDRLPVLADALEEAGCTDEAILTHCRSDRPHVRGCWVVDVLLGNS